MSFSFWFFRDVGFLRKTTTALYFSLKPWAIMGVVIYGSAVLMDYKMSKAGHGNEDDGFHPVCDTQPSQSGTSAGQALTSTASLASAAAAL